MSDCCAVCGVSHTDQHSSLGDARATAGLLGLFLTQTADRGAWLEWDAAAATASQTVWPTSPTATSVPSEVAAPPSSAASLSTRRWASKPKAPALVTVVRNMDLADALDEGATEGALPYLELVAAAFEDGVLSDDERVALTELAAELGLAPEQVVAAHRAFLLTLSHAALLDGKVSRAEKAELVHVGEILGLPRLLVADQVKAAEAARNERLSVGLKPLPPDWELGEPLRVGDKVVFTGCEAYGRDRLEERTQKLGVRITGWVSRRTTLLVTDGTVDGTKAAAARQCGTRLVHPTEFLVMLEYLQPAIPLEVKSQPPMRTAVAETQAGASATSRSALASVAVAPAVVRQWAKANGFDVGERGRIHRDVIEAYLLATAQ